MRRLDFNHGWTWKHLGDPGPGEPVTLPHDAMMGEKRGAGSGGNIAWFEGHDYLYSKTFSVPEDYRDKRVIFEFEGVYRKAEVCLNGQKAVYRPYGYTNFYVPADEYLNYGADNTISVAAHNADQPNSRWYSGAGIYRPVSMWVAGKRHILLNGVKVRTTGLSPVRASVSVETTGSGTVRAEILDAGGNVLASRAAPTGGSVTLSLCIPEALPWGCDAPNLYTCRVTYGPAEAGAVWDTAQMTVGFRIIGWDAHQGFTINGERVILRGACVHHDNGILGACAWPEAEERKVRLLRENGYNALRSAHNPCSKALLDACDRLGMLVMDEYVDCWYIHKTLYDYAEDFGYWWKEDLRDMVDKDYNHPCVILYSTGNEVSETAQPRGIALTGEMTRFLHKLDSTRPVTCGVNIFFNYLSSLGLGVYSDEKAKKEAGKRKKRSVGSEFYNKLADRLGDKTMKLGATLRGCDMKTRHAFARIDIAGYNYGVLRYSHDLKKYPDRLILGTETFCKDAWTFWELARDEPRIIGDFVWPGIGYLGEVGDNAFAYPEYTGGAAVGPGWVTGYSTRVDLIGNPGAEAAYTRVVFGLEQEPVIAVSPVNHTRDRRPPSAWGMTDAIVSWSWDGCEGEPALVEVYARAAAVELRINGKKAGRKRMGKECRAVFKTVYHSGTVTAIAYDAAGEELSRSSLTSAGRETVLRVSPEKQVLRPGELCFIHLDYTDDRGIIKPLVRGLLQVDVSCGKLMGLGNACPYNARGYLTNKTDTYYGRALAVVRANELGQIDMVVSDGTRRERLIL